MITKERLEELIKQEATIWTINKSGNINPIKTNRTCEIQRQYLMKEGKIYSYIEQTFETLEEAEWHKEFGYIERIDVRKLELPTYYEFVKEEKIVKFTNGINTYCLKFAWGIQDFIKLYIYRNNGEYMERLEKWELTEENYSIACKKCKELFLGD